MKDQNSSIKEFNKIIKPFFLTFKDPELEIKFERKRFNHLRTIRIFRWLFLPFMFILSARMVEVFIFAKLDVDCYSPTNYSATLNFVFLPIVYAIELVVHHTKCLRYFKGLTCTTYMFLSINYSAYDLHPKEFKDVCSSLPVFVFAFAVGIARTRTWLMSGIACAIGGVSKIVFHHLTSSYIYEELVFDVIYFAAYAVTASCFYVSEYNVRYNFFLSHKHELFKQSYFEMLQHLPSGLILLDSDNNPLTYNDEARAILSEELPLSPELFEENVSWNKSLKDSKETMMALLSKFVDKNTGSNLKAAVENWSDEKLDAAPKYEYVKDEEERIYTVKGLRGLFGTINCKILILQDQTSFYNLETLNAKYQKLYLASIVHDIRTPLNGIVGMLNMINLNEILEENARYLNSAKQMCKLMTFLTYDITDYSLLETNKFRVNISQVRLAEVLEEVHEMFKSNFQQRSLAFNVKIAKEVPEVAFIDRNRYTQILINLLGNALKYTFKGCVRLSLSYEAGSDLLVTEIEDTGIGIKEADFPKLFKLFGKLDANIEHCTPGVGFGLVICKRLAESMKGGISMRSKEGQGSAFTFTVKANTAEEDNPCGSSANEVPGSSDQKSKDKLKKYNNITIASIHVGKCLAELRGAAQCRSDDESALTTKAKEMVTLNAAEKEASEGAECEEAKKCSCRDLLFVDDSIQNLFVLKSYIKGSKVTADEALNGREAIAKVEERARGSCCRAYKLIVMDINMPVMNGIAATKELRNRMRSGELPNCPIVALSAQSLREDERRYFFDELGFNNYLTKPIAKIDFLEELKKYCATVANHR